MDTNEQYLSTSVCIINKGEEYRTGQIIMLSTSSGDGDHFGRIPEACEVQDTHIAHTLGWDYELAQKIISQNQPLKVVRNEGHTTEARLVKYIQVGQRALTEAFANLDEATQEILASYFGKEFLSYITTALLVPDPSDLDSIYIPRLGLYGKSAKILDQHGRYISKVSLLESCYVRMSEEYTREISYYLLITTADKEKPGKYTSSVLEVTRVIDERQTEGQQKSYKFDLLGELG